MLFRIINRAYKTISIPVRDREQVVEKVGNIKVVLISHDTKRIDMFGFVRY